MSERTDTSRSGDLVERLRERTCVVFNSPGVHPDTECLEAADRIEALEAENERLREAVQAQMDAKHREAAEAKLWFTKAQEWKAENARLLEELFLLKSLPDDIAETVIKLGPVEWGQTDPKDANGHGESVKNSVELTAAHFQQEGLQPMNGLYLVGEETVVCHTGTSPNSAQVARALTGAWNLMWDHARAALKEIEGD